MNEEKKANKTEGQGVELTEEQLAQVNSGAESEVLEFRIVNNLHSAE
ncbi:MAG: hypothetical protein KBS52_05480 [Clostridiales bacterium]|nr:hypothetical protein [Candidatus Equinaster intestinalis]